MIAIWQYFITANYSWILMEGLYLHNLIFRALFTDSSAITLYVLLGWGEWWSVWWGEWWSVWWGLPLLLVGSWASVRAAVDDSHCWMLHNKPWIFMVLIRIPVAFSVFLNFFFFINIVRVLSMKLRSSVSDENMKYRKLAKSTLVLVPLFGVHYCLLWGLSTSKHPTVELAWLVMDQVFASFQGFFVAVLYCLMNGEVRQEMRKMYYRRFGGTDHTFFNTGQSTMMSHTRVYTSRATRTSIHSLHSMTDRRERQSPSPKMCKKSTEHACGNCINTGDNSGNNCTNNCGNQGGNSCGIDCGEDCQKCGEGATLVGPSSYSLVPVGEPPLQEQGVEELIELQDRNHATSSTKPASDTQMIDLSQLQIASHQASFSPNTGGLQLEVGSQPISGSQNVSNLLNETRLDVSGGSSLTGPGPETELLCLIPHQDNINCDEYSMAERTALDGDVNIHQKTPFLNNDSDFKGITSPNQNDLIESRTNFKGKKEDSKFNDPSGDRFHEPLGVWNLGVNKDGADSVPRNSKALAQDLNPPIDPLANLENGRRELLEGQKSPQDNISKIFNDRQLQDKAMSPQMASIDFPTLESNFAKKIERSSKVKYCGESKVSTTVIAPEDENKEYKDETML
ncbi:GPCR family 2 secretin-like [Trinorchestia longiramus]|nr:GPCR family 2 secretin-like [Trinorchestia longiramus]